MHPQTILSTLRAMSWSELATYAFASFSLLTLLTLLAPPELDAMLRPAGLVIVLGLVAAKDLAHAPDAWRRLKVAKANRGSWFRYPAALLPPELVGLLKLDRQMWQGCLNRIKRRRPEPLPDGMQLTYLERGAYGTAASIAFVCVFLELPIDAMIVNLFVKDPSKLLLIHTLAALAVLYTLVYVVGDRWHVGAGHHVLTDDTLHLRVGARASGALPLAAIEGFETVDQAVPLWRRKRGVRSCDTLVVTPFDKPNCVLILKPEARVDILHWQVERQAPRYVFLYLDRPELLAARLRRN